MKRMSEIISAAACAAILLAGLGLAAAVPRALSLTVEPDRTVYPAGQRQNGIVSITIDAPEATARERQRKYSLNLAVVLDRSGSMSGRKIENAKAAARAALDLLGPGDVFSLVVYDDQAQVPVPALFVDDKGFIAKRIDAIRPGGGTALFAGVSAGAAEIRKNLGPRFVNRVILLSDGNANVGPSAPGELGRLGASLLKEGISVSTVGVGNDYNEDVMTALSQNSDGNFYFVENSNDLAMIFAKELGSALEVAAKSVRLRIECPEGVRPFGIIGHEAAVRDNAIELHFNQLYGGNARKLLLNVEIPGMAADARLDLAKVFLEYSTPDETARLEERAAVAVGFSGEAAVVSQSLNRAVAADLAVMQNAVAKEEAVRSADAGDLKKAAEILRVAAEKVKAVAVETQDEALLAEAEAGLQASQELEVQEDLAPAFRKQLKGESYQQRNSQKFMQRR